MRSFSCQYLPIVDALPDLKKALNARHEVVLEAPPGAGKTTGVPLALLDEAWLGDGIILMLEPRRLAARTAAERMAQQLGEKVGETVGYRIRLDNCIGPNTKIQVITEGILTRQLQRDPSLDGVALVIFDEFHERSLDADLGLALCLQGRELFREAAFPLKLLLMSATLDGDRVAAMIGTNAQNPAVVVRSQGRMFPVEIIHHKKNLPVSVPIAELCRNVVELVLQALAETQGSILVFLPGQAEISRTAEFLTQREHALLQSYGNILLMPLYGNLSLAEQRRVLQPAEKCKRKIVLATSIAETSLTVDGVTVIVDAGLSRQPQFDAKTALTRLQTVRLSRASSEQRAGRAGRTAPGRCYRLWTVSQQQALVAHSTPEIVQADLAPLALQLLQWGVDQPTELCWLDIPPAGSYRQALDLLTQLGAVTAVHSLKGAEKGVVERDKSKSRLSEHHSTPLQLNAHGKMMALLPLHPRLAHMLIVACGLGLKNLACDLAALLLERDPLTDKARSGHEVGVDIEQRLQWLRRSSSDQRLLRQRIVRQSQQYRTICKSLVISSVASRPVNKSTSPTMDPSVIVENPEDSRWIGFLLACAYPDRIASAKRSAIKKSLQASSQGSSGQGGSGQGRANQNYQLSNGRRVELMRGDHLEACDYLVCAQVGGLQGRAVDRIYLASKLELSLLSSHLSYLFSQREKIYWDDKRNRFIAERQTCLGALILHSEAITDIDPEVRAQILSDFVRERGLNLLPWTKKLRQWQARMVLMLELNSDINKNTLDRHSVRKAGKSSKTGSPLDTRSAHFPDVSDRGLLKTLEQWLLPYLRSVQHIDDFKKLDLSDMLLSLLSWQQTEQLNQFLPERITVPSGSFIAIDYLQSPPILAVRLQEMFGCTETPTVAAGRVPLLLHLLSPAQRPLQVTQDILGFWSGSYEQVKKDNKGRYPKHYWPDDPLQCEPTRRVKHPKKRF